MAISITFVNPVSVGINLEPLSPSPSCPTLLYPHVQTVPSAFKATVWFAPVTILGVAIAPSSNTLTSTVATFPR